MSSYFSYYTNSGFGNTPVSKGLLGYMFISCTALNLPLFAHLKKYLICKIPELFHKGEIWKIALSKLSFLDTKDFIFGGLLLYYFRVFERRYGSHKYASFLVATQVLSAIFELTILSTLHWLEVDFINGVQLPSGPFGIVFSLFVNYYFEIPRITQTSIFGVPITGKTLTYLLGLQICSSSVATVISAVCGLMAGLVYRNNVFNINNFIWVPKCIAKISYALFGRLLSSSPNVSLNGATLEIQRQEHIEMVEQQLIFNQPRGFRNFPHEFLTENDNPGLRNLRARREQIDATPSHLEENVQTLIEMGFERESVVRALRLTHNDVNSATHLLLQQTL